MSNIDERVKSIVVKQLSVKEEDVKNESKFIDDLGADSLDTVELVMGLEEEFDTEKLTFAVSTCVLLSHNSEYT